MSIGEVVQRDVDAAKNLFHNVEHKLVDGAREAFHEAQVLGASLEAKIVELGKITGATAHIDSAVAALVPVLAFVADHVNAISEPEVDKTEASFDPAAQVIMAEPAEVSPPPQPPVTGDPAHQVSETIVMTIAAGGADVTA